MNANPYHFMTRIDYAMTHVEVARALDISPSMAQKIESEALEKCRVFMERYPIGFEDILGALAGSTDSVPAGANSLQGVDIGGEA